MIKDTPSQRPFIASIFSFASLLLLLASSANAQNTALWQGVPGTSATTNWSDNANWLNSVGGNPGFTNNHVVFGSIGAAATAGTINSVANTSAETLSLTFTNQSDAAQFHTVLIPSGVTLSNANTLAVGLTTAVNDYATTVHITGGGTLVQRGTAMTVRNLGATTRSGPATLNMSGLSHFIYDAPGSTLTVAGGPSGSEARASGILWLAGESNYLSIGTLNLALGTGNGPANNIDNIINLGAGTNIINVGSVNVAAGKINVGQIGFAGETGGLRLRGAAGTDSSRADFMVARRGNTGSGTIRGSLLFDGHPIDIKAGTMTIGQSTANVSGQTTIGVLQFDEGTVDVTSLNLANCSGNAGALVNGTVTVGANATLLAGSISVVNQTLGGAQGYLNVFGGTVTVSAGITRSVAGTGSVAVANGGRLTVQTQLGTFDAPLTELNLTNAILRLPSGNPARAQAVTLNADGANTINVSSISAPESYPAQIPLIKYTSAGGNLDSFALGTLPGIYQGYLSNNVAGQSIDLVVTNGPVFLGLLTWNGMATGVPNANWDSATENWLLAGNPSVYFDGNPVLFDDTAAGPTNVNLTTTILPESVTVANSAKTYTFSGSGLLSGEMSLTKTGTGTLILNHDGASTFTGGFFISNGVVQVGNGSGGGNLGNGPVYNDGTLLFNRTNTVTVSGSLSGAGAITNIGSGLANLTGSGADFSGNVAVSAGTLRLGAANSGGSTPVFYVNPGGTLAVSGAATNSVMLVDGTLAGGASDFTMSTSSELTVPVGTVGVLRSYDPLNPLTSRNILVDGTLRGGGTILVRNADGVTAPDAQQGVRFRGTGLSDFTGTVIFTNNTKGEIRVDGSGPFTPLNTAKVILYAGAYDADQTVNSPAVGGYSDFLLRNNAGSSEIPTDFEIRGAGAVVFNGIGTPTDAVVTVGNLRMGGGQELIGYRGPSTITNTVAFSSVTLTGGTVTFSPHSPTFGVANQAGAHFMLSEVSQTAPSSLVMNGRRNLTLAGNINYSGTTTVSNGFLLINGYKDPAAGITVYGPGQLGGAGYINENVVVDGGSIWPGVPGTQPLGVFYLANKTLTLNNTTNVFTLSSGGSSSSIGGISTLSINGTMVLDLRLDPNATFAVGDTFTLFQYSGATLPASIVNSTQIVPVTGYSLSVVDPTTTPGSLKVRIDHAVKNLVWMGTAGNTWDLNNTVNWDKDLSGVANSTFTNLDTVIFNNYLVERTNVTLVGKLEPGQVKFENGFENMFLTGSGYLSGPGVLRLEGSQPVYIANTGTNDLTGPVLLNSAELQVISGGLGTGPLFMTNVLWATPVLTFNSTGTLDVHNTIAGNQGEIRQIGSGVTRLLATNTHTGPINVANGTLIAGTDAAVGTTNGATTIASGATLDLNGKTLGSEQVVAAGAGIGGLGAIVNNGTNASTSGTRFVTLTEDTVFGGSARWDIRGSPAALLTAGFPVKITKKGTNQVSLVAVANISPDIGDIDVQEGTFALQTTTAQVGNPTGTITVRSNATLNLYNLNVSPLNKQVVIENGGTIWNENGNSIVVGPLTLTQIASFNVGGTALILSNNVVNGGPLNRFTKSGSGSLQFVNNALPIATDLEVLGGTLDLSRATSTSLTLSGGQSLKGNGTIVAPVTIGSGATLSPGPAGTNAIGTLTANDTLTLQAISQTLMDLDAASTNNDRIVTTNLTYGGNLIVNNLNGTLAGGMSFRLFTAENYSGTFSSVQLPTLSDDLTWTNTLATDGRIAVVGGTVPPVIQTPRIVNAVRSGSNLVLSGTNGTANGTFHVVTSTNVSSPLSAWTIVSTNTFDANGAFSVTNVINPAQPRQFFNLRQQVP